MKRPSIEAALEKRACADLAFMGFIPIKVGTEGWPDRIVICGGGRHFWIEFKAKGGSVRPAQRVAMRVLMERGEEVYICDDIRQVHAIAKRVTPVSGKSRRADYLTEAAGSSAQGGTRQDGHHPDCVAGPGHSGACSTLRPGEGD